MDEKQNDQIDYSVRKLQVLEEDIKNEMKLNPNIINKESFIDALSDNIKKFINDNYRD